MKNKKYVIGGISSIIIVAVIVLASYRVYIRNMKINRIEILYAEFLEDYTKQIDIMVELNALKKDSDKKVAETAIKYHEKISQNSADKRVIDTLSEILEDLNGEYDSKYYLDKLKSINKDSEHYEKAQELIAELSKFADKSDSNFSKDSQSSTESNKNSNTIETNYKITITYYSKHYTTGSQKLNIKVKNTSGRDIRYLALDILEIDKSGNVVNSDWTNTSALIVDNAMVSIESYFDYQKSDSSLEFRIRDIKYK